MKRNRKLVQKFVSAVYFFFSVRQNNGKTIDQKVHTKTLPDLFQAHDAILALLVRLKTKLWHLIFVDGRKLMNNSMPNHSH